MKTPFIILLLFTTFAHARTYYVSENGNDNNNGTSPASALKTLAKVNAIFNDLHPGDKVLFNRGETFYGQLIVSQSGSADNPITIGAYGSGTAPVITGFTVVGSWTQVDKNIWESAAISGLDAINMLTIDGVQYAMGRYPNADAPNKGYLTIDSHQGKESITGNALSGTPDWTGGTVVMRINHWTLDNATISAQSGTTLTYNKPPSYEPSEGFGFFIENQPATLDQFGEWYYNSATKKLRLYSGTKNPERYSIKVSTVEKLITITKQDNITFDGIAIQGANNDGIFSNGDKGITVTNCTISFCGQRGINVEQKVSENFTATNNSISDCGNFGIDLRFAGKGQLVQNNVIRRIGLFAGMGGTGTQSRCAIISNSASQKTFSGNRIDSIGYAGIRFNGNDITIQQNVVSNFTLVLDDGGGIYTANQTGGEKSNRKILNNLVYNGIGAKEGTPKAAKQSSGIYIDDNSSDIEVAENSVWNCIKAGLYVHNAHNLNIHNNTFYNNGTQVVFTHDTDKFPTLTNVTFQYNTCFSTTNSQPVINFSTKDNDIASFGMVDNNLYLSPEDADQSIVAVTGLYQHGAQEKAKHTPDSWKGAYGYDAHSKFSQQPFGIRFEYNATTSPQKITLDRAYTDAGNAQYNGTATLQPYSAILLFPANAAGVANSKAAPDANGIKNRNEKKH